MFIEMSASLHLLFVFRHPWPLRRAVRLACPIYTGIAFGAGETHRPTQRPWVPENKNYVTLAFSINIPHLTGFQPNRRVLRPFLATNPTGIGHECPRAATLHWRAVIVTVSLFHVS